MDDTAPALSTGSAGVGPLASESSDALYLRAARALERSAALAEEHAERLRRIGQGHLVGLELERAKRAREAAERAHALASHLR